MKKSVFVALASAVTLLTFSAPTAQAATMSISLDPGDLTSFNRVNTTWTDTIGAQAGNNTSLTYNSANCGVFVASTGRSNFSAFDFGNGFAFTVWVKPNGNGGGMMGLVSNRGGGDGTNGFAFYYNTYATTDMKLILESGSGSGAGTNTLGTAGNVTADTWQQLGFSYNRTAGTAELFKNGVSIATGNVKTNAQVTGAWIVGGLIGGQYLNANLGIVHGFSTTITAAEALADYNSTVDRYAATPMCPPSPANTAAASVTGTSAYGETLTSTIGSWSGSPTTYTYQWSISATSGGTYTDIAGATAASYSPTSAQIGKYLKVTVTASNNRGSATSTSSASPVIAAGTPIAALTVPAMTIFHTSANITFQSNTAGKVKLQVAGKNIPGCQSLQVTAGNSYTVTCPWKNSSRSSQYISAIFTPVDTGFATTTVSKLSPGSSARTNKR